MTSPHASVWDPQVSERKERGAVWAGVGLSLAALAALSARDAWAWPNWARARGLFYFFWIKLFSPFFYKAKQPNF